MHTKEVKKYQSQSSIPLDFIEAGLQKLVREAGREREAHHKMRYS